MIMAREEGKSAPRQVVEPGSDEDRIIREETELLASVQRALAEREIAGSAGGEYDQELLSLRDQIAEARIEDIAPLVAEMYRLQALGARTGTGRSLPVDVDSPYFGHLKLSDGKKTRDVLVGNTGFVAPGGNGFAIVDWRNAPVSRIYYRYDEGEDFEESFGGKKSNGVVLMRRTVGIVDGVLRRITWSRGAVGRKADGTWVRLGDGDRPMLRGGAGLAERPPQNLEKPVPYAGGKLGVVGDEDLREDKRLRSITALIDRAQFDLITKPDSGTVILQGGAGSGKTTVALHRAAYLHFLNPQVFSPKKMVVVVQSPALTEYIARVLPSLGVGGVSVVTLRDWMSKTRRKVLPELKQKDVADVPPAVARLKKHPAVMQLLERAVAETAAQIGDELAAAAENEAAGKAIHDKWRSLNKLALLPRIRELGRWVETVQAERAGVTPKSKAAAQGVLRRARGPASDVLATWAQVLSDYSLVKDAVEARTPGRVSDQEVRELVAWVGQQAEELEATGDDRDEDEEGEGEQDEKSRQRTSRARQEAERALGHRPTSDDRVRDEDDDAEDDSIMRGVGVDGLHVDEDSPRGKLDAHDDALLLRLVQLIHGSLPIPGTQKTVSYEHIIVDEAQDLSPTDIAVLRGSLTSRESMTLAGDTAQKLIFDNGFEDWKGLLADLGVTGHEIEPLRISYRSTREIVKLSRHVLGPLADPVEPVTPRSGAPVEQFAFGTTGEAIAFIGESLRSLVMREKKASVAVIARYSAQATLYYEGLRNAEVPALRRVYGKDFSFAAGIDVVDVAQIKGLEYDYVVLVEANASTYPDAIEARHLLHIAATRAVHQLWVTSVGAPSPLLPPSD